LVILVLAGCVFATKLGCVSVDTKPTAPARETFQDRIDRFLANSGATPAVPLTTLFSESEVNRLLNDQLKPQIPSGIAEPQLRLLGNSRLSLRAIVDIEEFRKRRSGRSNSGSINFFSGKVPVLVRGDLIARDGRGQFKLQSAEMNGIPIPRALALELLGTYTRSRSRPNGFDLEKPFDLPLQLREIAISASEVALVH
jgi:hypothetical protein